VKWFWSSVTVIRVKMTLSVLLFIILLNNHVEISQNILPKKTHIFFTISGFAGQSCEVVLEQCDSNPCQNDALCFIVDDSYECFCVPDYHGKKCEYKYNDCVLPPLPK
jgi:hypothetical protein